MRTPASKKPDASHASPARRAAAGRRRPERSTRRRTEGCGGGSGGQDTKIYGGSDGVQRWGDARNGEQQAAAAKGAPATESSGAYLLGLRGTVCIRRTVGCSSSERRQRATWHNGGGRTRGGKQRLHLQGLQGAAAGSYGADLLGLQTDCGTPSWFRPRPSGPAFRPQMDEGS